MASTPPNSHTLRSFLTGLATHLEPDGEGRLVLSDLAEHLGLRTRAELTENIASGSLRIIDRLDTRAQPPALPIALPPCAPREPPRSSRYGDWGPASVDPTQSSTKPMSLTRCKLNPAIRRI